jgi:hypothetical protein
MSLMSRSRDEDQRFDPPLTAVWTAYATPQLAALFDLESSGPPAGQRLAGPCSTRETIGLVHSTSQEADIASSGRGIDVRGEVVDLLLEKIASDRNPSVTMMNMVEELLAPDDVPAYLGVLLDKVKSDRYPSLAMLRRLLALAS